MTIEKIKDNIKSNINKVLYFKINGSRNQIEEFKGIITSAYKSIFLIKIKDTDIIKSFSYTDILIGNLEILS